MICTTLNKIRVHSPCKSGWEKLLRHLGKIQADDDPLPLVTVLESNGISDTLWCFRSIPSYSYICGDFAIWCARQVQHPLQDSRLIDVLDVADKYSNGQAAASYAAADAAYAAARAEQKDKLIKLLTNKG